MGDFTKRVGKRKKQERWDPFEPATAGSPGDTALCYINNLYQVSIDTHESGWEHLSIVRRDRSATHDWRHLQRIKNELCGEEREAMELYPRESRLVDTNNQFHLWVSPAGTTIPVGYADRDISDQPFGAHKQRPFDEEPEGLNEGPRDPHARVQVFWPSEVNDGDDQG